ncbi:UPF0716 protein FxsA [Monaibacterium marinum]|uniref:UPF0716 protein FxsA n=1 Tax=Pontivivens marinum TaxID=1690039 RepID=A0A2C9CPK9_9RHOB|nr:FxsA family protein [Monaibacterium marinum]SOH93274.1 UPF0716 protein FxsA [Monaibacterium marinum]
MLIFLALIAVPLIEIALFIQVGGLIGLFPTLATVLLTAVVGTWLLRKQGGGALRELQHILQTGGDPRGPLAHGALILVAGILLLTPGFFTDALGFSLLVPFIRDIVIRELAKRVTVAATHRAGAEAGRGPGMRPDVIDGQYEVETPPEDGPRGNSGWTQPRE